MAKIIFLQLEIIPHCPPHIGMCFFIDDLKKKGISCESFIINFHYIEDILDGIIIIYVMI